MLATILLFISGERNVQVAGRSADAAKEAAGAALKQAEAADKQIVVMQSQLDEIKRQSVAAERASTTGRAYLFVKYETPQGSQISPKVAPAPMPRPDEPGKKERFQVEISYSIKNFGQTPAIITRLDTHVLISPDGGAVSHPPDPGSAEARQWFETLRTHTMPVNPSVESASYIIDNDSRTSEPVRIMIPAGGETGPLKQTFAFMDRVRPGSGNSAHGQWFYCALTYTDIFGTERHTYYYVGMFGAGFSYSPNPEHNRWD